MIYFDLEKQFSRAWHGDAHRSTSSCATFVLHLFSRERESTTMRIVAVFHPLSWILSQGNLVPGTRNVCRTLPPRTSPNDTHKQMLHRRILLNKFLCIINVTSCRYQKLLRWQINSVESFKNSWNKRKVKANNL